MENDKKQLVLKRMEQFQSECKQRNLPALQNSEYVRLKTIFLNDLSDRYGADIMDITFDELLPDFMGSGIHSIEQYIQSLESEFPFIEEELPENGTRPEQPGMGVPPADDQGSVADGEGSSPSNPSGGGQRQKRRTRERSASSNGIFWTPPSSATGNSKKIRELRNSINVLAKDRDILHRQFSIYRQDYSIIQGILEYGKKGSKPLEYNGLSLDNHQNVLHAALEILVKHLDSSGNTECFQNIKKFRDMAEDEVALFNEKISKLEKEIQRFSS